MWSQNKKGTEDVAMCTNLVFSPWALHQNKNNTKQKPCCSWLGPATPILGMEMEANSIHLTNSAKNYMWLLYSLTYKAADE